MVKTCFGESTDLDEYTIHIKLHTYIYIYIYTVRCLGSPGQKCVSKDNNMKNVVFAVAKRELLDVVLYSKNVHLRGSIFLSPRSISIDVITSTMQNAEIAFYGAKTNILNFC